MKDPDKRPVYLSAAAPLSIAGTLVLTGFFLYGSAGHDDSHLTYWAAHALRETGQILNYNGERVEQGSSVLHVVLLALLARVTGAPLPTLGPLTSIGGGIIAVLLTERLSRAVGSASATGDREPRSTNALFAQLLLVSSACFVFWSFGGIETTLAAAGLAWLVIRWERHLLERSRSSLASAALATAVVLTVRPESPICLLVTAAAMIVLSGLRALGRARGERLCEIRPALEIAALVVVGSTALFAFRHLYFGAFFPNPVYSKGSRLEVAKGIAYLGRVIVPEHVALFAAALLGAGFALRRALQRQEIRADVLAALLVLAYLGFIVFVGGDWMSGGRFVAHIAPLLCVLALSGLTGAFERRLSDGAESSPWFYRTALLTLALNVFGLVHLAATTEAGRVKGSVARIKGRLTERVGERGYTWFEVANMVHLRDTTLAAALVDIVTAIRAKEPERELSMMSPQGGFVPYHVLLNHPHGVRFFDLCQLSTRDFHGCKSPRVKKTAYGTMIRYLEYLEHRAEIDAMCGTRRPDILYMLGVGEDWQLEKEGYVVVYLQQGDIVGNGAFGFRGTRIADQYIAVDRALAERVGLKLTEPYTWDLR